MFFNKGNKMENILESLFGKSSLQRQIEEGLANGTLTIKSAGKDFVICQNETSTSEDISLSNM